MSNRETPILHETCEYFCNALVYWVSASNRRCIYLHIKLLCRMTNSINDEFIYDSVPYPSFVFPQTHPDRLATLAAFYNLLAPDVKNNRILELGCGDGTNLLAHAYAIPSAQFVGIDLSTVHIDVANSSKQKLKLQNIEFIQADVTELSLSELGKFDFIIAHGLFSWVPEPVREHILRIYRECLAENGIGYISYNALPGCHIRQISNGIMKYAGRNLASPIDKVSKGKSAINFIAKAASADSVYQNMLTLELQQISERTESNVFHDDIAEFNQPFYFHEFNDLLGENGLRYLCEAEPTHAMEKELSAETKEMLHKLTDDPIEREQYRDFIVGRRFRSSLICHESNVERVDLINSLFDEMLIATQLETDASESMLLDDSPVVFISPKAIKITLNHPITKVALATVNTNWPRAIGFSDLLSRLETAIGKASTAAELEMLRSYLSQLYLSGLVKLHRYQADFIVKVSEKPTANAFARFQVERGSKTVTTMTGTNLEPEYPAIKELIRLLDGTRTRDQLVVDIIDFAKNEDIDTIASPDETLEMIESNLETMAYAGLLIA